MENALADLARRFAELFTVAADAGFDAVASGRLPTQQQSVALHVVANPHLACELFSPIACEALAAQLVTCARGHSDAFAVCARNAAAAFRAPVREAA